MVEQYINRFRRTSSRKLSRRVARGTLTPGSERVCQTKREDESAADIPHGGEVELPDIAAIHRRLHV
jgi:hypothetical protein